MAIDLQALSITSAFNSIISFFRSQENNTGWKDLTTGSEGVFLIRMLANVLTNISYKLVTARRENYLSTAQLMSSNIGIAVNLGYSVFRGKNQHRKIQITSDADHPIPKYEVIGTYSDDYDIIVAKDCNILAGVENVVEVIIGKLNSFTIQPKTTAIKTFTRFEQNISEDFRLILNGTEVPKYNITENMKEMLDDKYLVRTNPYQSVDIMYLNNRTDFKYRYNDNSIITMEYVELADIPSTPFTEDMFFEGYQYVRTVSITDFQPFETVPEIKVNAPIDHEVQNLIRSKQDYVKRFRQQVPNVIQSSYIPVTPTYTLISYLKSNYTLVTDSELLGLYRVLVDENYFGTPLPDVTHPRRYITDLDIKIALSNKYIETSRIETDIENILKSNYTILMNQSFNVYDLERLIEGLSYVKYARVGLKVNTWEAGRKTQLGEIIDVDGTYYVADSVLGKSGPTEPEWKVPLESDVVPENIDLVDYKNLDEGVDVIPYFTTKDINLVWRAYKRLEVDNIHNWEGRKLYKIGDYVTSSQEGYENFMFKCVDVLKYSGTGTPDVSDVEIGDFLIDGNIVWVCKTSDNSYPDRERSHNYRLGDSVKIGGKSFEVISYTGRTSTSSSSIQIKDIYNIIEGSVTSPYYSVAVAEDLSSEIQPHDIVKVATATEEFTREVDSITYNNSVTTVIFTEPLESGLTYTELKTTVRVEQLTFNKNKYLIVDGSVEPPNYDSVTVEGNATLAIQPHDVVKVVTSDLIEYTREVSTIEYRGVTTNQTDIKFTVPLDSTQIDNGAKYTEIWVKDQGTYDEDIYWSIIDDINDVQYGWNVYNVFGYSVSII